jgi:hypothetical protein
MVSISNVNLSTPSAVDSAYATPAETAAPITLGTPPAPRSKVTVIDECNATVRDSAGRVLVSAAHSRLSLRCARVQ